MSMFRTSICRLVPLLVCALVLGLTAPMGADADVGQHGAITISSNADFTTVGSAAGCACVMSGNLAGTTVSNVSANEDGRGVELDNSSHITLDQLSLNKMTGNALFINGSSYVTLSNSKLKSTADGQQPHDADGLYVFNSDHLNIGGVPACTKVQICNSSAGAGGPICITLNGQKTFTGYYTDMQGGRTDPDQWIARQFDP
jgi:hypothetical protein